MTWILIVIVAMGQRGGVAVSSVEFGDRPACLVARDSIPSFDVRYAGTITVHAVCVAKSAAGLIK